MGLKLTEEPLDRDRGTMLMLVNEGYLKVSDS